MENQKTDIALPQGDSLKESLPKLLDRYQKQFAEFPVGTNILFDFGTDLSLLKYESCDLKVLDHHTHSHNRHVNILAFDIEDIEYLQELSGLRPKSNKPRKIVEKKDREINKLQGNVYGTHRLDFTWDPEFMAYLPSSDGRDLFLKIASEMGDGSIILRNDKTSFTADPELVEKRLRAITRPIYFEQVIKPFLVGQSTQFQMPQWKFGFFDWLLKRKGKTWHSDYQKVVRDLKLGDFLYVGCKEEVYCLCIPKEEQGLYMQGTYTTSTKPILYFSNNYLEFISKYDAKKPKFTGTGPVNVAEYRTYDIPSFQGKPFIFPQIGRCQDCKNTIFTGKPECVTGDLHEALEHFRTTDFSEFSDMVEQYGKTPDFIHPELEKIRNGRYFY